MFHRSTPRTDTFWGGKSELAASGGFEKDGVTTIYFRKKLEATEPSDHTIEDDLMHVIWAKGQVILDMKINYIEVILILIQLI